jgi:hypothetical protein
MVMWSRIGFESLLDPSGTAGDAALRVLHSTLLRLDGHDVLAIPLSREPKFTSEIIACRLAESAIDLGSRL